MSLNVAGLTAYTDENAMDLIRASLFESKTIGMIQVQPGIKSAATINILSSTPTWAAGACGWTAAGSTILTQKTITVSDIKKNEAICLNTLEAYYTQKMMNPGSYNESIPFQDLDTLDADKWRFILNYNLTSPYLAARKAAPYMRKRGGGRIVTISSVAGFKPSGSSIAYAVSKAGLVHLTRCLAVALAPDILINDIAPGLMEGTRMTDNLTREHVARSLNSAVLKKAADKDDVADAVLLFTKTDSITGQTLLIDAGSFFH